MNNLAYISIVSLHLQFLYMQAFIWVGGQTSRQHCYLFSIPPSTVCLWINLFIYLSPPRQSLGQWHSHSLHHECFNRSCFIVACFTEQVTNSSKTDKKSWIIHQPSDQAFYMLWWPDYVVNDTSYFLLTRCQVCFAELLNQLSILSVSKSTRLSTIFCLSLRMSVQLFVLHLCPLLRVGRQLSVTNL